MSQDDFFNQSFSSSTTQRRKPPPPPPPAAPSSSGSSTNPRTSTAPLSGPGTYRPVISVGNKPSTFYNPHTTTTNNISNNSSNLNQISNNKSSMLQKRPTGDYYPTTSTISAPSPSFPSYTNPYAVTSTKTFDALKANTEENEDWFSNEDQQQNHWNSSNNHIHNTYSSHPYTNTSTTQVTKSESMELLSASSMKAPNSDSSIGFTGTMSFNTSLSNNNMYDASNTTHTTTTTTGNIYDTAAQNTYTFHDYSNEPPLLEELGINLDHIKTKSLAVILPMKYAKTHIDKSIMEDSDLAGPLVYGLLLATELLLAGKISFGVIYGFGLFSSLATTLVLNLMSPSDSISIWTSVSILGYSLLPVNVLAAINIFYRVKFMGTIGVVLASLTIAWCTISSTRLIEKGCEMRQQRWLVGYPNALLYSAFVMLTIF
jgi:protein YIPF5/7